MKQIFRDHSGNSGISQYTAMPTSSRTRTKYGEKVFFFFFWVSHICRIFFRHQFVLCNIKPLELLKVLSRLIFSYVLSVINSTYSFLFCFSTILHTFDCLVCPHPHLFMVLLICFWSESLWILLLGSLALFYLILYAFYFVCEARLLYPV